MKPSSTDAKVLFLSPDGSIYPDNLICSSVIPAELNGKPCSYSNNGRFPNPITINPDDPNYTIDKGQPADLCPPCTKPTLSQPSHWQQNNRNKYPEELYSLRLFKCRQWFWVVVPGLHRQNPTQLRSEENL